MVAGRRSFTGAIAKQPRFFRPSVHHTSARSYVCIEKHDSNVMDWREISYLVFLRKLVPFRFQFCNRLKIRDIYVKTYIYVVGPKVSGLTYKSRVKCKML